MGLVQLKMPELGLPDEPIRVTVWLVRKGSRVEQGEPILEVTAGSVLVDLPAPACGLLVTKLIAEDDLVEPGRPLAIIDTDL